MEAMFRQIEELVRLGELTKRAWSEMYKLWSKGRDTCL